MPTVARRLIPIWMTVPMLRPLLPLVVGILFAYLFPGGFWYYLFLFGCVALVIGLLSAYKYPNSFGVALIIFGVSVGGLLYFQSSSKNQTDFIGTLYQEEQLISVILTEPLESKPKSWRSVGQVSLFDSSSRTWLPMSGKLILYLSKDSFDNELGPGSVLVLKKPLQPIKNSGNPGAFDYVSYAAANDWYYQVFLRHDEYLVSGKKFSIGWRIWPLKARNHVLGILKKYIPDERSLGVAQAILTGYRNDMDKELSWKYAGTGVAHIIAISGLHLGIIQAGLIFLFSPLFKRKYGKQISYLLIIIFLWFFALLTGASPSVLRAAFMFSLLLLGQVIGREGNSFNTLCASAFVLLLFQPNLLFNVGFQLSYSAVLSIFLFSKPIANLLKTNNSIIHKIWSMLSVTLAAQILTLPFVLYYFHQFPVYFLLANVLAIPLVWLVLNLCLLLTLVFWWLSPVAIFLGKAVHIAISAMNRYIDFIDGLPFSRIENISFSLPEAVLLMVMLAFFSRWALYSNKRAAMVGFTILAFLFIAREWKWSRSARQVKMVVYNIPGYSAMDFISGHRAEFLGDSIVLQDPNLFRNHILPARILYRVSESSVIQVDSSLFYTINFGKKHILVLNKLPDIKTSRPVETNIMVLAAPIKLFPERLLQVISADTIIADGKLPYYRIKEWQIAADSLHLHFHSTTENGAFVLNLERDGN
jgi:competence protein ComEC